jgi:DNA-binding NarL/FixJ family response regulator
VLNGVRLTSVAYPRHIDRGEILAELSETERRIVELVCCGATNREIAHSMFLSIKAVEANLTRLYRRIGVNNRGQLARALAEAD